MYSGPIILTDSRGRYLRYVMDELCTRGPKVHFVPGATIDSMYDEIQFLQRHNQVSALYLLVGVNDLTWRDKKSKRSYAAYFTPEELCSDITEKVEYLMDFAIRELNIPRVVMLPILGIDVGRYNKDPIRNPWQGVIDRGLKAVNKNIITINAAFNNSTPLIHFYIYKSMEHSRIKTLYGRLWDGLHPRGDTLYRWGEGIVRAMQLNRDL